VHLEHELKLVASCPVMAAITLLRGRWKLPVIWNLQEGRRTLAEMRRVFPMASEKMLAQHVGELVRDGFVERRENARDRLDVSYALTPLGRSLAPTLQALREWGDGQGVTKRALASLTRAAE
jgi:DNA-binding HxlR family transcriptional regulator